jgi:CRISPR-associated protein Csx17
MSGQFTVMPTALMISPLSRYLGALGLLKIVNEQIDANACGFWRQGCFHLEAGISPEELVEFFATHYRPTPCLTPWNKPKGSKGFLDGIIPPAIASLEGERFAAIHAVAAMAARVMPAYLSAGKVQGEEKVKAFEHLSRDGNSDAFAAWLNVCAITTTDSRGKPMARFPALLGGSGGFMGADFGEQFVRSLAIASAPHYQAAIFGGRNDAVLESDGNTLIYDPAGRGDGQQGYRVATSDTQASRANPAELILLAEGATFFQGYALTAHQDEQGKGGDRVASFTLAVLHNSAGHPSSSWLENKGQRSEELWCPLWDEPVPLVEVRDALGRKALLPLPRQISTGTDFALYASRLGRERGLSGFARYFFPPRVGQGTKIPSLIEVVSLSPDREDRTDALAAVARFASILRWRASDSAIPASYRHTAERVVAELETLSGGGGSFAQILRYLVAWRHQENLNTKDRKQLQRFRFSRTEDGRPRGADRELPSEWYSFLARELDGPEWRLGLALSSRRPFASLTDVLLLLEDRLDVALINDLELGLSWIDRDGLPEQPDPNEQIPWLPADYLAGLLLHQWPFPERTPVEGDRARWRALLLTDRANEAMEVALLRLRISEVVSWPWPAISGTRPDLLLKAVELPIQWSALRRMVWP